MIGHSGMSATGDTNYGRAPRWRSAASQSSLRKGKSRSGQRTRGMTLTELMVVLTIIGILVAMSTPSFHRTIEQSHADIAGANLRAIWAAQRVYWLEYQTYAAALSELESLGLLDPSITSVTSRYAYSIQDADANSFLASATRIGSAQWSGQFTIDEQGIVSGTVQASGKPQITPGFQ